MNQTKNSLKNLLSRVIFRCRWPGVNITSPATNLSQVSMIPAIIWLSFVVDTGKEPTVKIYSTLWELLEFFLFEMKTVWWKEMRGNWFRTSMNLNSHDNLHLSLKKNKKMVNIPDGFCLEVVPAIHLLPTCTLYSWDTVNFLIYHKIQMLYVAEMLFLK